MAEAQRNKRAGKQDRNETMGLFSLLLRQCGDQDDIASAVYSLATNKVRTLELNRIPGLYNCLSI